MSKDIITNSDDLILFQKGVSDPPHDLLNIMPFLKNLNFSCSISANHLFNLLKEIKLFDTHSKGKPLPFVLSFKTSNLSDLFYMINVYF